MKVSWIFKRGYVSTFDDNDIELTYELDDEAPFLVCKDVHPFIFNCPCNWVVS